VGKGRESGERKAVKSGIGKGGGAGEALLRAQALPSDYLSILPLLLYVNQGSGGQ